MSSSPLIKQLKAARRVSTPLIAITTPDPAATIETLCEGLNSNVPKLAWDVVTGLSARNAEGKELLAELVQDFDPTEGNPVECAKLALKFPEGTMLFVMMANRWIGDPSFVQAVWNLRDKFKQNRRTFIMLAPDLELPAELRGDVVCFDEPLPGAEQLTAIVNDCYEAADLEPESSDTVERAVEATQGLPAFLVEQVTLMSLEKEGLDIDTLWERKRQEIDKTRCLSVFRDAEPLDAVGGVPVIKKRVRRTMNGKAKPSAIVFIDEIEKMLAGAIGQGDTSGTSKDQLGVLLQYMQDHKCRGMIFVGPAGSAKSMVAKAAGSAGGVPTIQLDLGAAKGSLVGESEQNIRQALKVITSVSNDQTLWIATCNNISQLPPELRRRFTRGTYYFDLPTQEERDEIWPKQLEAHGLDTDADRMERPRDHQWTGAEIKACCDIAVDEDCSLVEAAESIVPVARSAPETLEDLRTLADGRFLSASYPGAYEKNREQAAPKRGRRSLDLGKDGA